MIYSDSICSSFHLSHCVGDRSITSCPVQQEFAIPLILRLQSLPCEAIVRCYQTFLISLKRHIRSFIYRMHI